MNIENIGQCFEHEKGDSDRLYYMQIDGGLPGNPHPTVEKELRVFKKQQQPQVHGQRKSQQKIPCFSLRASGEGLPDKKVAGAHGNEKQYETARNLEVKKQAEQQQPKIPNRNLPNDQRINRVKDKKQHKKQHRVELQRILRLKGKYLGK